MWPFSRRRKRANAASLTADERRDFVAQLVPEPGRLLPTLRPIPPIRPEFQTKRAAAALQDVLLNERFDTVLDVGSGGGEHAAIFVRHGKQVTEIDFGTSVYAQAPRSGSSDTVILKDFNDVTFDRSFDLIWASHVLEHQPNVQAFLRKIAGLTHEGGLIAITVPPAKFQLVGGHLTLWTPALLLYNLVVAGLDCREARVLCYGYNISVILRRRSVSLPPLTYDKGDIERLAAFLPPGVHEGMYGFEM